MAVKVAIAASPPFKKLKDTNLQLVISYIVMIYKLKCPFKVFYLYLKGKVKS